LLREGLPVLEPKWVQNLTTHRRFFSSVFKKDGAGKGFEPQPKEISPAILSFDASLPTGTVERFNYDKRVEV
jgi:hypothetical protein